LENGIKKHHHHLILLAIIITSNCLKWMALQTMIKTTRTWHILNTHIVLRLFFILFSVLLLLYVCSSSDEETNKQREMKLSDEIKFLFGFAYCWLNCCYTVDDVCWVSFRSNKNKGHQKKNYRATKEAQRGHSRKTKMRSDLFAIFISFF
jgi:arginine exporter protein ArgO